MLVAHNITNQGGANLGVLSMDEPIFTLHHGDCREQVALLEENSVGALIADPPCHLTSSKGTAKGILEQKWAGCDVAFQPETWCSFMKCMKPGDYLVAFSSAKTYHNMAKAVEAAGSKIKDQIMWLYGSGSPKSLDIVRARIEDACRQDDGQQEVMEL